MAKSSSAIINLSDEDLQFTDTTSASQVGGTTHTFNQVPDSAIDDDLDDDKANLLGGGRVNKYNFWSMEFYQQFFDVDDHEVKDRILSAMMPRPRRSFLEDVLKRKPDLYGPIWICTTLVISVAVTGNLASYIQMAWSGETNFHWQYDFHKVTLAATAVFSYAWVVPMLLYGFLWWTTSGALAAISFLDLLCLYGYSLVIYIPVSVLWLIQNAAVQWILVAVSAGLSGAVIVLTLWPIFKENASKICLVLIVVIVALHLLMACGFMLYFFHVPSQSGSGTVPALQNAPVKDAVKDSNVDSKEDNKSQEKEAEAAKEGKREAEAVVANKDNENQNESDVKEIGKEDKSRENVPDVLLNEAKDRVKPKEASKDETVVVKEEPPNKAENAIQA